MNDLIGWSFKIKNTFQYVTAFTIENNQTSESQQTAAAQQTVAATSSRYSRQTLRPAAAS